MTKFFNIKTIALTVAAASVLGAATPGFAQTTEAPINISVQYADLDVTHAAGAKILFQRIKIASVKACGGAAGDHVLAKRASFDQCRNTAMSQAVAKVNAPMLTAMASHDTPPVLVAAR